MYGPAVAHSGRIFVLDSDAAAMAAANKLAFSLGQMPTVAMPRFEVM